MTFISTIEAIVEVGADIELVDVDENGFMYLLDRNIGLDILKFDNNLKR